MEAQLVLCSAESLMGRWMALLSESLVGAESETLSGMLRLIMMPTTASLHLDAQ